jgi:transposase-like protein
VQLLIRLADLPREIACLRSGCGEAANWFRAGSDVTTNSVESLHMQVRKTIKTRGHFPNDDAALRLIWLAIQRAKTTWRTCYNWTQAMAVLRIHFGDRIPDNT